MKIEILSQNLSDQPNKLRIERSIFAFEVWENVEITTRCSRPMPLLERYVIEFALATKSFSHVELYDVAAIPDDLACRLLGSLKSLNLLTRDGEWWSPVVDNCVAALKTKALSREEKVHRSCVWFPISSELVVLKQGRNFLSEISRLKCIYKMPVSEEMRKPQDRNHLMNNLLEKNCCYSEDGLQISSLKSDGAIPELVNAFDCSAEVNLDRRTWSLSVTGFERWQVDSEKTVRVTLTLLPDLLSIWLALIEANRNDIQKLVDEKLGVESNFEESYISAGIGAEAFHEIASKTLVSTNLAISCEVTNQDSSKTTLCLPLKIFPASDALDLFKQDDEIRQFLLSSGKSDFDFETTSETDAIDRLWQLEMFKEVYLIREGRDFCFDNN